MSVVVIYTRIRTLNHCTFRIYGRDFSGGKGRRLQRTPLIRRTRLFVREINLEACGPLILQKLFSALGS